MNHPQINFPNVVLSLLKSPSVALSCSPERIQTLGPAFLDSTTWTQDIWLTSNLWTLPCLWLCLCTSHLLKHSIPTFIYQNSNHLSIPAQLNSHPLPIFCVYCLVLYMCEYMAIFIWINNISCLQ